MNSTYSMIFFQVPKKRIKQRPPVIERIMLIKYNLYLNLLLESFYIHIFFSCIEHERKLDTRQPWGITVIVAPECSKNAIFADFGL